MDNFHRFQGTIEDIELPTKFTFPFNYEVHPLALLAAKELQTYLIDKRDWEHNFGLDQLKKSDIIGKMFGVLVVENEHGDLGYLTAFSGKIADSNHHQGFVPPVFDILQKDGFFRQEELLIYELNKELENLIQIPSFLQTKKELEQTLRTSEEELAMLRKGIKEGKKKRKQKREEANEIYSETEMNHLEEELVKQSLDEQFHYKRTVKSWKAKIEELEQNVSFFEEKIDALKKERKERSAKLQKRLFSQYTFLNAHKNSSSLWEIFDGNPPAGAGECAAPKLLQYAFIHNYHPIALAEFWWGKSPESIIRKHQYYYPACRSKCEPILGHMLQGLEVDENPIQQQISDQPIEILFEDEYILVINKPTELLSVPGKTETNSVYTQVQKFYPKATGPLIVHRLDMSTSGLMVIAKTKQVHKILQQQFLERTVQKRYIALLNKELVDEEGFIELPLRVDLDNRPQQMVCYEYGKHARTRWKKVSVEDGKTRVHFYPITGRTHQLRVHAAHSLGLNAPIVGDDLYGTRSSRLCLHAETLKFTHPVTNKIISFKVAAKF